MEKLIKTAKGILELGLIQKQEEGWYVVDESNIKHVKTSNTNYMSCDCKSCTRNCNIDNLCSRKIAVILYESQEFKLKKLIRTNMATAKQSKELGISIDPDTMINLLNDLKRFI